VTGLLAGIDGLTAFRIAVKALLYGACLLAAGSALFQVAHRSDAATARRTRRVAAASAASGIALAGLLVLGEVLFLAGGAWSVVRDPMLWRVVLDTPIGDAQAWRVAGLGLVVLLIAGPSLRWPAALGAVLIAG